MAVLLSLHRRISLFQAAMSSGTFEQEKRRDALRPALPLRPLVVIISDLE